MEKSENKQENVKILYIQTATDNFTCDKFKIIEDKELSIDQKCNRIDKAFELYCKRISLLNEIYSQEIKKN